MSEEFLIALHCVGVADPVAPIVSTGQWTPDGLPIVKRNTKMIHPGVSFPTKWLTDGGAHYLRVDAARRPEPLEVKAVAKWGGIHPAHERVTGYIDNARREGAPMLAAFCDRAVLDALLSADPKEATA